jgi:hypothetical protein
MLRIPLYLLAESVGDVRQRNLHTEKVLLVVIDYSRVCNTSVSWYINDLYSQFGYAHVDEAP